MPRGKSYIGWVDVKTDIPPGLYKRFRKRCIEDEVHIKTLILSFCHAYANGEITCTANPAMVSATGLPNLAKTGYIDDYRVLLKDASGKVLNPIPFSDDIL